MRRFLILWLPLAAGACAPLRYDVQVDARGGTSMPPAARVSVVAATRVDPTLGPEVKGKIERLLKERGYEVVRPMGPADTVDLVLLAVFGVGDPSGSYAGTAVAPLVDMLKSAPAGAAAQARWLIVAVARPRDLGPEVRMEGVPWVWRATTYSTDAHGDLAHTIDYLLVPTFEWFGRSTGERVGTRIEQYDPRVRALVNPPEE